MEQLTRGLVNWASASRPRVGGQESGDACLVRVLPDSVLVAVVDGLGHGADAAAAARRAVALLGERDCEDPLDTLRRCHAALRPTRGVVMSLARFEMGHDTMTWAGVGNVEGAVLRSVEPAYSEVVALRQCNGVVGRRLPTLHAARVSVMPGDTLIFATDGIRPLFLLDLGCAKSLQELADRILAEFWSGADDALVVVVRYRGALP
jgi:serine/threonine protein phosphatase PrpC